MSITQSKLVTMPSTGYDFTDSSTGYSFIVMNSYDVNNRPPCEEWTDANYNLHRVMTRTRKVEGSFQVKFRRKTDYETFLSTFGNTTYNYTPVLLSVYVNNMGTVITAYFYIEYTTKDEIPYMDGGKEDSLEGFTITITEV